jgi:fructan beta-fructosidase
MLLRTITLTSALLIAPVFTSCGSDEPFEDTFKPNPNNPSGEGGTDNPSGGGTDNPSGGGTTPQANYNEQYRPQIHYTPARNWVNDPNGMVYIDGTWHLFYQYNPYGNSWGNMSWGHATSTDLVHWIEQPTALVKDELGDIFSGSAVCDANNTAGFGTNAMVAFYTSSGTHQQQSMAYSTDGGKTFTKFANNPVIANTTRGDFRDPKVFWHAETNRWVMCLALGWEYGIQFWTSTDLRTWREASTFTTDVTRCKRGQWECPDLLRMNYNGQDKWVLVVSVNPGGPVSGSGTMYFVGDFDGEKFVADDLSYPLWLDFGMDNYAGVTWSNAPDGRIILLGWMNNWLYAGDVPCDPWRSTFTLPRELSLIDYQGKPLLASRPVGEIDKLASEWNTVGNTGGSINASAAYRLQITLDANQANTITLSNGEHESYELTYSPSAGSLIAHRNSKTGAATFNGSYSIPSITGTLSNTGDVLTLDIYVDQSSVEIFTSNGSMAMTNLVFPTTIYNQVTLSQAAQTIRYQALSSIWK